MEKRKRKTYRRRMFLYFMAITTIPLLVLGIYSYNSASDALRENIRQANETALMQVENKIENVLHLIRQGAMRTVSGSQMENIAEQEFSQIPYSQLRDFVEELSGDEAYVNYINGYTFVNYKKKWVLSNKGMVTLSQVQNKDWLEELYKAPNKLYWTNRADQEDDLTLLKQEHVNHNYLTLIVKGPLYTTHTDAALILNLNRNAIERLLDDSIGNGSLLVFDQNNDLVYTKNLDLAEYYRENPDALERKEETTLMLEQDNYDIVKRKSEVSGWTFVAAFDAAIASEQLQQIPITTLGLIVVVLIICGVLSSFGAFWMYRPVKSLMERVKGMVPEDDAQEGDEFIMIESGFHTLMGHNEALSEMMERQKGQLAELLAMRLIQGCISSEELDKTKNRLEIEFKSCMCVVSVIFCPKLERNKVQMEQDVLNLELLARLPQEIHELLMFPPFIQTRAIVMILDEISPIRMEKKLLALRNCLSVFATSVCNGYMDMGVSQIFEDDHNFQKAYRESQEALKINERYERDDKESEISLEDSAVTYYADLIGQNMGADRDHLILDIAIKEAVDSGNQKKAFEIVEMFLRDMNKSGAVLYEQHYYRYRFLLAILSVPSDAGIPIHDLFPTEMGNIFQRFNQLYDVQSVKDFYENQIIVSVIQRMNQFRRSSSEVVMEKIVKLIASCQGDLTLSECAEQLGYHPSYIWRIMKQTQNITFTDYVAAQKLELAKNMLIETKLSVTEIGEELKYSNAQNFIRLFKKHMGITPGQYRKEYKQNSKS